MRPHLLSILLLFATTIHAANSLKVSEWTQKTLTNTLSIDFNYDSSDAEQHSNGFTPFAWHALSGFLGGYLQKIRAQHLTIHPTFLIAPTIVDSGTASGITYWRINAEVLLAEINVKVAFSLIVIATNPSTNEPYLIQSISMIKQENP
jgi:hypothetical protein